MAAGIKREDYRMAAGISPNGLYRYWLTREWGPYGQATKFAVFILLNPSKGDARIDDATIRRCVGFAKSWGYTGVRILNLFAFRTTYPKDLYAAGSPVGTENNLQLELEAAMGNDLIVCAWGCHGTFRDRDIEVAKILGRRSLHCLGLTKDGHPKHPVRLSGKLQPIPFTIRSVS